MPVTSLSRRADGSRIATSETLAPAGSASRPAIVAGFVSSALIESSTRLLVAPGDRRQGRQTCDRRRGRRRECAVARDLAIAIAVSPPWPIALQAYARSSGAHSSCELNEEPHSQRRNDEEQQCAHSRGASPIIRSTSRLPVSPPDFRFSVGDDRNVTRHWSASWILSDMLWRGLFHPHIVASGGRMAPDRTVQPDIDLKLPAMPAVYTADTQRVATVALMDSSCMLQVYGPALNGAVPECTRTPQSHTSVALRAQPRG